MAVYAFSFRQSSRFPRPPTRNKNKIVYLGVGASLSGNLLLAGALFRGTSLSESATNMGGGKLARDRHLLKAPATENASFLKNESFLKKTR
jgi:hypothetical protein